MHIRILLPLFAFILIAVSGASAQAAQTIWMSGMGGKCLDVKGGNITQGAEVIGYPCHGGSNQTFDFPAPSGGSASGPIKIGGLCVDIKGGAGRQGDNLVLWQCHGGANQQFTWRNNQLVGMNNMCVDLEYGEGAWMRLQFEGQRAIMWQCHGGNNQKWYWSKLFSSVQGGSKIQSGQLAPIKPMPVAQIVAGGAGNLIANDGASIVSGGAGNIVAGGAGN